VDVGAAVVADEQSFELVEPGEGAFDDPAVAAQAGAVPGVASCDLGFDAALSELAAAARVVVGAVAGDAVGPSAGPADLAAYRRDAVEERDQLGAVVAVAAGERPRERDPAALDEEVVLGAQSGSINRARARRGAPLFACTWLASTTARDHSISPAARKRASSSACSRSQTPAFCHSSKRRQQVTPEPKPSSAGRCVHEIPVCSTNRTPCSACRSGKRFRPGWRKRRSLTGNSGSTSPHSSSETIHGATAIGTPLSLTTDADGVRRQRRGPCLITKGALSQPVAAEFKAECLALLDEAASTRTPGCGRSTRRLGCRAQLAPGNALHDPSVAGALRKPGGVEETVDLVLLVDRFGVRSRGSVDARHGHRGARERGRLEVHRARAPRS
jgi:hypothetical protein